MPVSENLNTEFMNIMKSLFGSHEHTAIPVQMYTSLFNEQMRDDILIVLPKADSDMFGEELRVNIQNIMVSQFQQRIELRVYNSESQELSQIDL